MSYELKAGMGLSNLQTRKHSDEAWRRRVAELEAEVAELRKDKARLEAVIHRSWIPVESFDGEVWNILDEGNSRIIMTRAMGWREAIDAAMKGEPA